MGKASLPVSLVLSDQIAAARAIRREHAGMSRVVVVGQGYVGLPLAMRAVEIGHDVVGFDVDPYRVKRLADGASYVEDVSDDELAVALASGRFQPSSEARSCAGFDIA